MNPVKANIVDKPEHYVYSSAREFQSLQACRCNVFNSLGALVKTDLSIEQNQIDVSSFSSGMYLLQCFDKNDDKRTALFLKE